MKYIKIIAVIFIFSLVYLISTRNDLPIDSTDKYLTQEKTGNRVIKKDVVLNKTKKKVIHKKLKKDFENEVYKILQPLNNNDLEFAWEDEYGCWNRKECNYNWLNARTLEEAIWMRNNGYPTVSMLRLINDDRYKDELAELTRRKFPAALAVATISAMEQGNFKEGFNLALSNVAHSNNSQIYPHYLLGEALLANDMKPLAISQFYIAGILGDPLAQGRAMSLSSDIPVATTALNSAHQYISRVFGTEVPNDPRPDGG